MAGNRNEPSETALTLNPTTSPRGTKRVSEIDLDDGSRKHGKRLTTKEEVSLFELCNRHADTFGKRSDICNWWKSIAAEFTYAHGRPYSWHSVRRKVEVVTKQRIKFLEEQRGRQRDFSGSGGTPVEDLMNPQWCKVLDAWIPNWQRWEEAEARRIAKRDEMIMRRRSSQGQSLKPGEQWRLNEEGEAGRMRVSVSSASPDGIDVGVGVGVGIGANNTNRPFRGEGSHESGERPHNSEPTPAPAPIITHSFETPSAPTANTVKLPPGFENMFSKPMPINQVTPPAPLAPRNPPADSSNNSHMFGAVLETLGKLNKHLDAASSTSDVRASPVISALVQAASVSNSQQPPVSLQENERETQQYPGLYDINRIKDDLRQELRAELRHEMKRERAALDERLDSVQRTQEMILEMLRQEPS